jgi:Polysaccharide lyase
MKMNKKLFASRGIFLIITAALLIDALTGPARASLLWNGSASLGLGVFKTINIQDAGGTYTSNPSPNGSYVRAINDATYGVIWDFYKDNDDRRSECHAASGFQAARGSQYYLGWGFKLTSTVNNNAIFQWKAYGSPMVQNFPLVIKMVSGQLQLHYFPPGGGDVTLWSRSISANTWYKVYLRIRVSDSTSGGSVSLWFNDAQQTLSNGSTSYTGKTFDGSSVDPKWGIYGATGTSLHDYVRHLRIGTALADVQF